MWPPLHHKKLQVGDEIKKKKDNMNRNRLPSDFSENLPSDERLERKSSDTTVA